MLLLGKRNVGKIANLQWREKEQAEVRGRERVSSHFIFCYITRRLTPLVRGFSEIITHQCQTPRRLRQR